MASIRTVLELVNQQFLSAIKQSEDSVKNFKNNVQGAGDQFKNSFGAMDIAATALGATLLATGHQVMAFADDVTDIATAHQEAVSQVLALQAALQANGGKAENAGRMYLEMAKNIDQANGGNLKLTKSFQDLGVSIEDLGSASESEIRNKLIAGLAAIKDPAERASKAFQVFGKAATGVDFVALGKSIEENNAKYAQHEAALNSAGAAYDKLGQIAIDTKVAFAEAFKPVFDAISKLNPSVEDLTTKFKIMGIALGVITAASVARGVWALVTAFNALRVAVMANPLLAIASVLATVGVAAATYFGVFDDGNQTMDDNTKATDDNTKASEKNAKTKRDQANLFVAQQKELEALTKITEAYARGNEQLQKKLDMELAGITLSEDQKRSAQQVADIETSRDKALIDLKNQYNQLDADGRGRQKKAYDDQRTAIIENADLEIKAATETLGLIQQRKNAYNDITSALSIYSKAEEDIYKLQSQMRPQSTSEKIAIDEEQNRVLERRRIILEAMKKSGQGGNLYNIGEGLLKSTDPLAKSVQGAIDKLNELRGMPGDEVGLINSVQEQLQAVDEAAQRVTAQKEAVAEAQRSFSYGWEKSFKEYVDNATNAATTAETLFKKATSGMEDALVNFAKTGKFEWKNFVNMMVEELLRSQIRQLMASIFTVGKSGGGGGGLFGDLWSGAKSLFGFANGGPVQGNTPILVGEQGPEVFVPSSNGSIVPNGSLGGSTVVTYNISAVDARSFQQLLARDPQFIHAVAEQGRLSLPQTRR